LRFSSTVSAGAAYQRAAAGNTAHHILRGELGFERGIGSIQQKIQLFPGAVHIVQITVIIFIGGTQIGDIAPAGNGRAAFAPGDGDGDRAVIANFEPRNRDMDAFCRADL
jgi:hypothetical protein